MLGSSPRPVHDFSFLVESRFLVKTALGAVQVGDATCNQPPPGVEPRSAANAVARIDDRVSVETGTEICPPGLVTCVDGPGQCLTVAIRSGKSTEVATVAGPDTGDEEAEVSDPMHRRRWRRIWRALDQSVLDDSR